MSRLRLLALGLGAVALTLALNGCGGRAARPVTVTQSFDTDMTCAQLASEIEANKQRINSLHKEDSDRQGRNAAMATAGVLLVGVGALFLIDTGEAQETEINAYTARNNHLTQEAASDGCTQEEMAAAVAANSAYTSAAAAKAASGAPGSSTQLATASAKSKDPQAQAQFDAWYTTNKEALRRAVSDELRKKDQLAACGAGAKTNDLVNVTGVTVNGRDESGYHATIAYTGCAGDRQDAFLLRIENDQLAAATYAGAAAPAATAASAAPQAATSAASSAPAGPAWAGEWNGEVDIRNGRLTMTVIDGAVALRVLYEGKVRESSGTLGSGGRYATSISLSNSYTTTLIEISGTFPNFTVKLFSGVSHDPDQSITLTFVGPTTAAANHAMTPIDWSGSWQGEAKFPDGAVKLDVVDGLVTTTVMVAGRSKESTTPLGADGSLSTSMTMSNPFANGPLTVEVKGSFPTFTVTYNDNYKPTSPKTVTVARQ